MNKYHELSGRFVLVHPNLTFDPADKKNQVGSIESADLENDNIVVGFSDGSKALFSTDALLVMREIDEIRGYADYDMDLLFREDYFDIIEVCMTAEATNMGGLKAAIQLAAKNPMAVEYAMRPIDEELGLTRQKGISR